MIVRMTAARWERQDLIDDGPIIINLANVACIESYGPYNGINGTRVRFVGGAEVLTLESFETLSRKVYQALGCEEPK